MKGKKKVKEAPGMNIPEIFAALSMLEKERGIPQTFMMDKIIQAVTTAYKRDHRDVENVIVDVDEEHQTLKMYVQKNVVEEEDYVDPFNEIPIQDARAISAKYQVGDVANVRVVKLMTFGAFAEVVPGVDGLIHISQIANRRQRQAGHHSGPAGSRAGHGVR